MNFLKKLPPRPSTYVISARTMDIMWGVVILNYFFGAVQLEVLYPFILELLILKKLDKAGQTMSEDLPTTQKKYYSYFKWSLLVLILIGNIAIKYLDPNFSFIPS